MARFGPLIDLHISADLNLNQTHLGANNQSFITSQIWHYMDATHSIFLTSWLHDWIELLLQYIGTHTWSTCWNFQESDIQGRAKIIITIYKQEVYTQLQDLNLYNSILQSMRVFDDDDDDLKMHWNNNRWWIQADIQNFSNYFWRSESGQDEQIIFFMLSFENVSYRKKHFSCK